MNLRKLVQRRFLSFLASRWGMVVCLVGALFLLNTCVSLLHHFLAAPPAAALLSAPAPLPDRSSSPAHYSAYGAPIDIVYTWVNGSDPRLVQGKAPLPPSLSLSISTPPPTSHVPPPQHSRKRVPPSPPLAVLSPHSFFCYFFLLFFFSVSLSTHKVRAAQWCDA